MWGDSFVLSGRIRRHLLPVLISGPSSIDGLALALAAATAVNGIAQPPKSMPVLR
jgi:hypothetical protein